MKQNLEKCLLATNSQPRHWRRASGLTFSPCVQANRLALSPLSPPECFLRLALLFHGSATVRKRGEHDVGVKTGRNLGNHVTLRSVILSTVTVHCHLAEIAGYEYLTNLQLAHLPT